MENQQPSNTFNISNCNVNIYNYYYISNSPEKIVYYPALVNKKKKEFNFFIINYEDLDLVLSYKWYMSASGYAFYYDKNKKQKVYLHVEIMNRIDGKIKEKNEQIDHIDRNK